VVERITYCRNCGNDLPDDARFCSNCGQPQDTPTSHQEQSTAPDSPKSPPPKQKQGLSRTTKAVIVVIGIVLIAAWLGSGNRENTSPSSSSSDRESESNSSPSPSPTPPSPSSEEKSKKGSETASATYGIGDTITVGDASWVVNNVERSGVLSDSFGARPAREGNFVIVDFAFTNNGDKAKTLHQQALEVVDSSGSRSEPDTDTLLYIPNELNIFLEQVNPGVTENGRVIFSLSPDASGLKLVLKDTNLFKSGQNQAEVDLGF
jgi:hypothetical protein